MNKKIKNFTNILQAELFAKESIRKGTFNWLVSGAENNYTRDQNIDALNKIKIYPNILAKVGNPKIETSFFGKKINSPVFLCPMGHQTQFYSSGEFATAKGVNDNGNLGFFSTQGRVSFNAIKNKYPKSKLVWQIFPFGNYDWMLKEIKRAENSKSLAISFCFDAPVRSFRYMDRETGYDARKFGHRYYPVPPDPTKALTYDWELIKWIKKKTNLKILPKGLMSIEDIKLAIKYGADGIWISNHGGRMFNSGFSVAEIIYRTKRFIKPGLPILVDGGVRKGTDIIKYMCLGANFVGIGRPAIYGLIIDGSSGVKRIFQILESELISAMQNGGFKNLNFFKKKRIDIKI